MEQAESDAVLDWLVGGFNHRLSEEARPVWEATLAQLDAAAAMQVAMQYSSRAQTGDRFPTAGDFRRAVHALQQGEQPAVPETAAEEPDDWCYVWSWARYLRDPRERRYLPQEAGWEHEPDRLTQAEYEWLHGEWIAAGSPKDLSKLREVLSSMP